jgi:hypothetical protein
MRKITVKNKIEQQAKCYVIQNVLRLISFIQTRHQFTVADIQEELDCHRNTAKKYLMALSIELPIVEIEPRNWDCANGSTLPVYGLLRED